MKCFLTSDALIPNTNLLNPANAFLDNLRACIPDPCRALFVCSDPDHSERTDRFAGLLQASFESAGFGFSQFDILDRRNQTEAPDLVSCAEVILLAGGRVPVQNRFFSQINLKDRIHSFTGVLIGISAGSMNSAEVVYARPESDGDAVDPAYQRFLPGLGLTKKMILPHYQRGKVEMLDGLRIMEDIVYPDSRGREFYALVDGSYLYIDNGLEKIFGEAYRVADGELTQISSLGNAVVV